MSRAIWTVLWISLIFVNTGWGISSDDIHRLSKAGMGAETIQLIIKEKVVETCAFTVQELIDLKTNAKLSDKTLQVLITEGSFLKDRSPVVYGQDVKPVSLTTVADIIELKRAGISDDIIQAIIISGSASRNASERDKAWQMLNNMGIVVDTRKKP
ncbi:MAG: hypothetical protein HY881_08795 [Deltaproteobacteria bacterium]|nr:hypothetical protein [Deltaproteobacteria bacterium]